MKQPIVAFLKQQLGNKPAVIGLSGGVDSAVVAALLVEAVGANQVHAFVLPSQTNAAADTTDAENLAMQLGIHHDVIAIDPVIEAFLATGASDDAKVIGNIKARVRMITLYSRANALGGLVVGTGNLTELKLGYFTKYGDGGVDVLPIGHLYKTEVWKLAKELKLPEQFITKAPTAGLWMGQTDEQELGVSYQTADAILQAIEAGTSLAEFKPEDVANVQQRMQWARHKLVAVPSPSR